MRDDDDQNCKIDLDRRLDRRDYGARRLLQHVDAFAGAYAADAADGRIAVVATDSLYVPISASRDLPAAATRDVSVAGLGERR